MPVVKELLVSKFCLLVVEFVLFLLALIFFLVLLLDLKHEAYREDQPDKESQNKGTAENVAD